MIEIQPLSKETLTAAIDLANKVFQYQRWWEKASWAFKLSLMHGYLPKLLLGFLGISWCRYWVAVNSQADVLGVTGLYTQRGDAETYWLGWTCVNPEARGQGIGAKLVDFAINQAKNDGANDLKLYTSDLPSNAIARQLYERRGFELVQQVPQQRQQRTFNILYYQLPLK
ncbi:GNAT family N-acetyltransferase [Tolypothrix sp. PCC 7910]|uniref:GNAT family N-acetyltransferase n=1 Tax=Tolypothrix sp. PCC 7910 TaxID=2099387 RepID=UPI0014278FC5|nr:GNAT family N-acetyltransferase [Tolypothrix sp. PCC 7910]QIR35486.1 GNAT family N-acetyltransferase [Tolypothrix sp. PCC 7910]